MGYQTRFYGLDVDYDVSDPISVEHWEADQIAGKEFGSYELKFDLDDYDTMKWYDWEKDCQELSLNYPNLLFSLKGEGEEGGDLWKAWFRNGKSITVRPKLDFPKPADIDEKLPLIPQNDIRKAQLELEVVAAIRRVEELQAQLDAA